MSIIKKHKLERLEAINAKIRAAVLKHQAGSPKHQTAMKKQKEENKKHDTAVIKEGLQKATREELARAAIEKLRKQGEAES